MSFITYNGVSMTLIQTRRFIQEPIKIGQDIAGFRYTATVLANLNTNTFGTQAPSVINTRRGLEIWNDLRERLMAQRRKFLMTVGNIVIADIVATDPLLATGQAIPLDADKRDIELGPKPLACNVVQFNGGGSVLVEFTIQWAVPNPCPNLVIPQSVLAHVWGVNEQLDEDFFVTRTYQGRVRLNPQVVQPGGTINPDSLRSTLFPPIDPGLRRTNIQTKLSEDGFTLDYLVTDTQLHQLVNSKEVTRIVASHSIKQTAITPAQALDAVNRIGAIAGGRLERHRTAPTTDRQRNDAALNPASVPGRGARLVNAAGTSLAAAQDIGQLASTVLSMLTMVTHDFQATAYGTNAAGYNTLAQAARVVCLWRLMNFAPLAVAADWGGNAETQNESEPRCTTFSIQVHSRPRFIYRTTFVDQERAAAGGGNTVEIDGAWGAGNNTIPTVDGDGVGGFTGDLTDKEILTPDNTKTPLHIKQLLYGATPGWGVNDWNGVAGAANTSFAPDLLGTRDSNFRPNFPNGTNAPGQTALEYSIVCALQNPCSVKVPKSNVGS